MNKGNGKIILVIIISVIFGLAGGVVGEIVARVSLMEKVLNIPLSGVINLNNGIGGNTGFVIRDAKKVVVEQNDKVRETSNSVNSGIIGIFENTAIDKTQENDNLKQGDYLRLSDEVGQGFVITSDGWIVSSFIPAEYRNDLATKTKESILAKYFIATRDRSVYSVDDLVIDPDSYYAFWHIQASDFPVKKFTALNDVKVGDIALFMNWEGDVTVTSITSIRLDDDSRIKSSENRNYQVKVNSLSKEDMSSGLLFNLNGDLVALANKGELSFIGNLGPCLKCLFSNQAIAYPAFGIFYIDLSEIIFHDTKSIKYGALVYKNSEGISVVKNSPAAKAGLQEGDIIISINNIEINGQNSLPYILNQYQSGAVVTVEFNRGNKKLNAEVVL